MRSSLLLPVLCLVAFHSGRSETMLSGQAAIEADFTQDAPGVRYKITVADLPESIRDESPGTTDFVIPAHRTLAEIEKMAILQTLQRTNWNKQEAAQILGLYRPTLYSKMKKHDIRDAGKTARAEAERHS